jgi:hypothetical protein
MEIIIAVVAAGIVAYVAYKHLNKEKADGSHPLDSVTGGKPEAWPFPTSRPKEGDADKAPYKIEPPVKEELSVMPILTEALDVNKDGKVDLADAKEAVKKTKEKAKKATAKVKEKADVNKDGKVDLKDVKEAVKKAAPKKKKK